MCRTPNLYSKFLPLLALSALPALASPNFTLNKVAYPGNALFTNLQTLSTTSPVISTWSVGVPLVYAITIDVSNPAQTTPIDITLKENLDPNFVALSVTCSAFIGATCPTVVPQTGNIAGIKIAVGQRVVVLVRGYYQAAGDFQNTFSVFETATPTKEEQGPPKNLLIQGDWSILDMKLTKKPTNVSATSLPATIQYEIVIQADANHDFYVGNLLRLRDRLTATFPPQMSFSISGYTCVTNSGSTCPSAPSPATGSFTTDVYLSWPNSTTAVIKKGDTITLTFNVLLSTVSTCGNTKVTINNQVYFTPLGFVYSDKNNFNHNPPATINDFNTNLQPCLAAGTISKKRVCLATGCPPVNWGDIVTYEIVVTNPTNTPQVMQVHDYVSKPSITVPLKATLVPSGSPPKDVNCSPAIITCTTVPSSPATLVADDQTYLLFTTSFTLPANGSVTLKFDVRIDKLSDCQMDPKNVFTNTGYLYVQVPNPPNQPYFAYVNKSPFSVDLPELRPCEMQVTKSLVAPAGGLIIFGQPVSFKIDYMNNSTLPVTVHTLRDVLNLSGAGSYGTIPIQAGSLVRNCSSTTGVGPMPVYPALTQIVQSFPPWNGQVVIQEANSLTGITFPGKTGSTPSSMTCTVSFIPLAPSTTDNKCEGQGSPKLVNNAYADVSGLNGSLQPSAWATATADLPLCRKVSVLKTVRDSTGASNPSTGPNGTLTFEIKVTNDGNDAVSDFELHDPLPPGFTIDTNSISCNPALCTWTTPGGTQLDVKFNPIPGKSDVVVSFKVTAPLAGGTSFNTATGTFSAGANFYFEGDPATLLVNSAQVQVLTPTLMKVFKDPAISVNGTTLLTFTIVNQTSDPAQQNIAFTDSLPTGMTVTNFPPNACGGTVSVSNNAISLVGGSLPQGQHSCQFNVEVKASACGVYINDKSKFLLESIKNLDVTQPSASTSLTVTGCPPALTIKKQIEGGPVPLTEPFTFFVTCTGPAGLIEKTVTITPPATTATVDNVPVGSKCQVAESPQLPKLPDGYMWSGTPVYSPENGMVGIGENGGLVTVKNTIRKCNDRGQIKIVKKVTGVPADFVGTFKFLVTCVAGGVVTTYPVVSINYPKDTFVLVDGVPSGGTCTVQELTLPGLKGLYQWTSPIYSPPSGKVSTEGDCCPTITVTNTAKFCCDTKPGTDTGYPSKTGATPAGVPPAAASRPRAKK